LNIFTVGSPSEYKSGLGIFGKRSIVEKSTLCVTAVVTEGSITQRLCV
jgi:hypothetical protein